MLIQLFACHILTRKNQLGETKATISSYGGNNKCLYHLKFEPRTFSFGTKRSFGTNAQGKLPRWGKQRVREKPLNRIYF